MNVSARLSAERLAPEREPAPATSPADVSAFGSFLAPLLHPHATPPAPVEEGGEVVASAVAGEVPSVPAAPPEGIRPAFAPAPEALMELQGTSPAEGTLRQVEHAEAVPAASATAPSTLASQASVVSEPVTAVPVPAVSEPAAALPPAGPAAPVGSLEPNHPAAQQTMPEPASSAEPTEAPTMPANAPRTAQASGSARPLMFEPTPAATTDVPPAEAKQNLPPPPQHTDGGVEAAPDSPQEPQPLQPMPVRGGTPVAVPPGSNPEPTPRAAAPVPSPPVDSDAPRPGAEAPASGPATPDVAVMTTEAVPASEAGAVEEVANEPTPSIEGAPEVSAEADARSSNSGNGEGRHQPPAQQIPADAQATPPALRADGTNVPVDGKDVRVVKTVAEVAEEEAIVAEEATSRPVEIEAMPDATVPDGLPPLDRERAAQASQAPARAEAQAAPPRTETARTPQATALLDRWQADLQGLVTELRTEAGGWQRLRLHLDDEGGTVTLRARREADHVAVTVAFSDPGLRQVAQASAERLHTALETQLGQQVAFSFDGGGGDARQHASTGDRATPSFAPSTTPSESDRPAPLPRRRATANREWIG